MHHLSLLSFVFLVHCLGQDDVAVYLQYVYMYSTVLAFAAVLLKGR